jgi:hypothetical protein
MCTSRRWYEVNDHSYSHKNKDGHMVAHHRAPLKANGERISWEDSTPIQVKDIARLTNKLTISGIGRMETSGVVLKP